MIISGVFAAIEFLDFVSTLPPALEVDSDVFSCDFVRVSRVILEATEHVFSYDFHQHQDNKRFILFMQVNL